MGWLNRSNEGAADVELWVLDLLDLRLSTRLRFYSKILLRFQLLVTALLSVGHLKKETVGDPRFHPSRRYSDKHEHTQ